MEEFDKSIQKLTVLLESKNDDIHNTLKDYLKELRRYNNKYPILENVYQKYNHYMDNDVREVLFSASLKQEWWC